MEVKRRRKQELKERKNYLPTVLIVLCLWLAVAIFILLVDPQISWAIPLFLLLIFAAVMLTFAIVFGNTRRGVLLAMGITIFLGLKILNMASPLNTILLIGALAAFEFYYSRM